MKDTSKSLSSVKATVILFYLNKLQICQIIANSAWGLLKKEEDGTYSWTLASEELSEKKPKHLQSLNEEEYVTYRIFLDKLHPLKQPTEISDSAERKRLNEPIE